MRSQAYLNTPRWLEAWATPRARAPQKGPPEKGPLPVLAWQIPHTLRHHRAWAVWRYEFDNSRWSKPPYIPDSQPPEKAEPSDADTWREFEVAHRAYTDSPEDWAGVSFALDERWGIVGVDLDHVSQHQTDASRILRMLNSYTELTPSGDGLRIFVRGHLPAGRRRRNWVEMYTQRRFLTVTGQHVDDTPTDIRSSPYLVGCWQRWLQQDAARG